jgi:HIRAN domain.
MEIILAIALGAVVIWFLKQVADTRRGQETRFPAPQTQQFRLGGGSGDYDMEVVGESHYLDNLRKIAGHGDIYHECDAVLRMEDDNPHDRNAVAVYINGMKVGYLSRAVAKDYRKQVEPHGKLDGTCGAVIIGGGEGRPNLGVWLDLPVK